ncbi:MAG: protein phosphatase 2C domain-containing protein [Chitinophagaceae bacterium]
METLHISANTHTGQRRKENQDAWVARQLWSADKALLAVIDGVGGYKGGERAAAIAKDCIEQYMQTPSGDTLTMLREALVFANNRIAEERKTDQRTSEMCCVLTAAIADQSKQEIYFVHVGDTRFYRYRAGQLQKLTKDHSIVGIREDAGEISEEEAMEHPHRNQILREVGSVQHRLDDEDFMDYGSQPFLPGDVLLLCSDGLTDMISSRQITQILTTNQPLPAKVNRLIELANKKGGHDNITVVLLQYPAIKTAAKKEEVIVPVEQTTVTPVVQTAPVKKSTGNRIIKLATVLLLVLLVAIAGLYFREPVKKQLNTTAIPVVVPDTAVEKITEREHTAVEGPETTPIPDTMWLSASKELITIQQYTDSTHTPLVLLPQKNNRKHFPAITIGNSSAKPGDTLNLAGLQVTGFETGIEVQVPVVLKTGNLVFENTSIPFRYLIKPGDKQASVLFMHTGKQ